MCQADSLTIQYHFKYTMQFLTNTSNYEFLIFEK